MVTGSARAPPAPGPGGQEVGLLRAMLQDRGLDLDELDLLLQEHLEPVFRRAPCHQGRVSSAYTCPINPCSQALRITPNAVPYPPVASEPVLQWVMTPLAGMA